jgi:hypothetical protein
MGGQANANLVTMFQPAQLFQGFGQLQSGRLQGDKIPEDFGAEAVKTNMLEITELRMPWSWGRTVEPGNGGTAKVQGVHVDIGRNEHFAGVIQVVVIGDQLGQGSDTSRGISKCAA